MAATIKCACAVVDAGAPGAMTVDCSALFLAEHAVRRRSFAYSKIHVNQRAAQSKNYG